MSTPELRKKLIARIRATTDVKLLREMERMLEEAGTAIAIYKTDAAERAAINKGLEDIKKGRVRSAAKANKAVEEWLAK